MESNWNGFRYGFNRQQRNCNQNYPSSSDSHFHPNNYYQESITHRSNSNMVQDQIYMMNNYHQYRLANDQQNNHTRPFPSQQMGNRNSYRYQQKRYAQRAKPSVRDHNPIEFSNNLRQWTTVSETYNTSEKTNPERESITFSFMSYNILAQELLEKHLNLYKHHNKQHLKWNIRWYNLQNEINYHKADIICLQEVQATHYQTHFMDFFKKIGYEGVFKKRTGQTYPDGCAIFYNTRKFRKLEAEQVEYFQPDIALLNRNNVGIVARFEPYGHSNKSFVVATTHLLYNPKREDVRIAQMQLLLTEIGRIAYNQEEKKMDPVILCGDFNSGVKKDSNGVYQLITEKVVDYVKFNKYGSSWLPPHIGITNNCKHLNLAIKRHDNNILTRAEEEQLIQIYHSERTKEKSLVDPDTDISNDLFTTGKLMHDFNFIPVYSQDEGVSTNHDEWITVDYLFYSRMEQNAKMGLKLLQRYDLPTKTKLKERNIKSIPNNYLGSDHFSLVAKFQFEF